jgi:hypothetical protein
MLSRPRIAIALIAIVAATAIVLAQSPADRVPFSIPVEHIHSMGANCKGELTIDKWLFSYRSSDKPEDNRDWKMTELKAAESKKPDELILRTRESGAKTLGQDKNYKFKVPGGMDKAVVDYMNDRIN